MCPFEKVFLDVIDKHGPLKEKVVRANHAPFITKTLRKAHVKQSYLEKVYFKKKNSRFFNKIKKNPSRITNNKSFSKNIQTFFSEKR